MEFPMSNKLQALTLNLLFLVCISGARLANAQTFSILHNFTGGYDGYYPAASLVDRSGVVLDATGTIYGTTAEGGNGQICGVAYEIAR
jgi:hypothetical protein